MADLVTQAAWALAGAFVLSLAYEVYRATAKAGTSPHDSWASFVILDWFEDLMFTSLVFLATVLLLYQVLGVTLES